MVRRCPERYRTPPSGLGQTPGTAPHMWSCAPSIAVSHAGRLSADHGPREAKEAARLGDLAPVAWH